MYIFVILNYSKIILLFFFVPYKLCATVHQEVPYAYQVDQIIGVHENKPTFA